MDSLLSQLRVTSKSVLYTLAFQSWLTSAATVAAGFFAYYCIRVVKVPELVAKNGSKWQSFLQRHVPALQERYWSSVWCYEARFQTVAASLVNAFERNLLYTREILELSDGGQLCLDWIIDETKADFESLKQSSMQCNGVAHKNGKTLANGHTVLENCDSNHVDTGSSDGKTCRNGVTNNGVSPSEAEKTVDKSFAITSQPLLVILPGLTGSSESEYVKNIARSGQQSDYRVMVFNNRGKGGVRLTNQRTYCASNCDDFAEAVEMLSDRYQLERTAYRGSRDTCDDTCLCKHASKTHGDTSETDRDTSETQGDGTETQGTTDKDSSHCKCYAKQKPMIVVVGISLGGIIMSHYITSQPEIARQRLTACVGVSIPYNLFVGLESLERPWLNMALNRHLAGCLGRSVEELGYMLKDSEEWDYESVIKSATIRDFDSQFTSVQFGFPTVEDYYRQASLHDKMQTATVPFLGINAQDDPFQPLKGIPLNTVRASPNLAMVITSHGGHIAFLEGFTANSWVAKLLRQLLTAVASSPDELGELRDSA